MKRISDVEKIVVHIKYNPNISYDDLKLKFRQEFNKKWSNIVPSPETGLQDYDPLSTMSAGAFGRMIVVKKQNSYYAVKVLIKEKIVKMHREAHIRTERKVLSSIGFPFLINLEFSAKDFDNLYLGMPFINGCDLFTYHRKCRKFNEKQARFYAAQVFMALEYLHFLHLIYRDLKPENILIDSTGYIKITDFCFAKKVESRTLTLCGTPEYMAPEIIRAQPYGASVDWWAFGIFVYELVSGMSPFAKHNRDVMAMYAKICDGDYNIPANFSAPLKDLVNQLLQVDINERLGGLTNGINDIKDHVWFSTINWYSLLNHQITPPHIPELTRMEDLKNCENCPAPTTLAKSAKNLHADVFAYF